VSARFALGQVVATPGALALLERHGVGALGFLARHASGDWGACDAHDARENDLAVAHGLRVFSAYPIAPEAVAARRGHGEGVLWIITEADRSATTLLTPDEY
jgi:hypothetical protein